MLYDTAVPCSIASYTNIYVSLFMKHKIKQKHARKKNRKMRNEEKSLFKTVSVHVARTDTHWSIFYLNCNFTMCFFLNVAVAIADAEVDVVVAVLRSIHFLFIVSSQWCGSIACVYHKYSPIAYFLNTRRKFMRCT